MFRARLVPKKNAIHYRILITLSLILSSSISTATNWEERITITGFASAIYQQTDEASALHNSSTNGGIDNRGSFQGSKLALNVTAQVNDKTKLYSQFLGQHGGDNYDMNVDWAFIDFTLSNEWSLRAGKIKFPVGIVNEYVSVGYTYPWLRPPNVIYSTQVPIGAQVTREAYSGSSLLWNKLLDDWTVGLDLFAGEVKMNVADVRKLRGITLRADWDDQLLIQFSRYGGIMENSTTMPAMNQQPHNVTTLGVKLDINNIVAYAEIADVTMGTVAAMTANTWYTTLGYRIGKWLPHLSYESFEKGDPLAHKQNLTTLGLRYEILPDTALKFSLASINSEKGSGMFDSAPNDNSTLLFGFGVDIIF